MNSQSSQSPNLWMDEIQPFYQGPFNFFNDFNSGGRLQRNNLDSPPFMGWAAPQEDIISPGQSWINPITVDELPPLSTIPQLRWSEFREVPPKSKGFQIKSLKSRCFKKEMDDCKECSICLQKFSKPLKIRSLPCEHEFHLRCIDKWFKKVESCPLCRWSYEG